MDERVDQGTSKARTSKVITKDQRQSSPRWSMMRLIRYSTPHSNSQQDATHTQPAQLKPGKQIILKIKEQECFFFV